MIRSIVSTVVVVAAAGMAGCQSGPSWAWWKRDTAPEDKSLIARSAEPSLPSSQAKPEVVAGTGMTPATSPSSANLAAAGADPSRAAATSQAAAATIATAPTANYPTSYPSTGATPVALAGIPRTDVSNTAQPAVGTTAAPTAVASAGPYDPNGYRPASAATGMAATTPASAASADRYGNSLADPFAERYQASSAAGAAGPVGATSSASHGDSDRYGVMATAAPPSLVPNTSAPATPSAPATDRYGATLSDRYGLAQPTVTPTHPATNIDTTPVAAPVQLTSAPGQYRPGGTSTYTGATAGHLEIATRPSEAVPETSAPATTAPAPYPPATVNPLRPY